MRKTCNMAALLVCIGTLLSPACRAQMMAANASPEMAVAVRSTVLQEQPKPTHRFFDRRNVGLAAMTFSAALADGVTTQHALGIHHTSTTIANGMVSTTTVNYVERNPLAAPLVNRGWAGQITATALTAGPTYATTHH